MKADAELARLGHEVAISVLHPDVGDWYQELTDQEKRVVMALACYELGYVKPKEKTAQRKAQRLLRTWLTDEQRRELARRQAFDVVGTLGGRYRLRPSMGCTGRIERHGKNYYESATYCLHDDAAELPPADLTLTHYLMIVTDEADFLAQANEYPRKLWDGQWMRRLNAARRRRAAEQAVA